ncbi:hypothetical protein CRUP_032504 [Coryphaenoides rupestris]|nr:hypothetical protein CRUP_032504 [Coryphaenoides rupestris]
MGDLVSSGPPMGILDHPPDTSHLCPPTDAILVPEDTCQRWDKKRKRYVTISRPSIVCEHNSKMGGVDLVDRMMSYYRMSVRTKKWTLRMLMHFTDLALANSWLVYRKDLTVCGTPEKSIMQFLEFRMEVAKTFLAQRDNGVPEDDADLSRNFAMGGGKPGPLKALVPGVRSSTNPPPHSPASPRG